MSSSPSCIAGGTEIAIEPGVELFREGAPADFWWVLVDGEIELSRGSTARTPWSPGWTSRAAGPAGSGRGTNTAPTWPPVAGPGLAGLLRVPAAVLRERSPPGSRSVGT